MKSDIRARIFISCGQCRVSEEEVIADKLEAELGRLGYDAYVAINDQTTQGFKENILARLEESEYFIFIDFKRDKLCKKGWGKREYRGSLFANQELAIAISQDKRIIAFQESGVKTPDGMINVTQINPIAFMSRERIVDLVIEIVKRKLEERQWSTTSRDEIEIDREAGDFKDVYYGGENIKPARFFHVKAQNRNIYKTARNCICFIKEITDLQTGRCRTPEFVEIKWMIVKSPDISIPPKTIRKYDGFFILKNNYNKAYLGYNRNIIDYPAIDLEYQLEAPGQYLITYMLYSDNFRPAHASFKLILPGRYEEIDFAKMPINRERS